MIVAVKTIFRQAKWGLHFAKCFFFFAQKWNRVPTVLLRRQRSRHSVAQQHANTQSFICKAGGLVMWYASTLVMVWVPGFLSHGSKAKMESMNSICCVSSFFFFLSFSVSQNSFALTLPTFMLFWKITLLIQMAPFLTSCISTSLFI